MTDKKTKTVSHNPAQVEFPSDPWGMTSALRKAGLQAAQSVRGNDEKHELFIATLRVLAQHAAARLPVDAQALKDRLAEIAEREAREHQRTFSRGVPAPVKTEAPAKPDAE